MARPIVGNPFENQIPTVSATANPVDIYVRPSEKNSPFAALAASLSRLEQKALPIFEEERQRRAEAEFAEGQELYAKTRKSIGDAVKAGIIDEGASPYLRKGYRVANLNVLSARYATELNEALVAQKLYTNGNPAAIEDFTQKFYADFQEKYDFDGFGTTEVADYFLTTASKANEAFRESWKTKHLTYQKEQNYLAFQNEVGSYINSSFLETDTAESRAVKMANLGKWVTNKAKEAAVDGMDMSKINKNIIDSVVLSAYEMNDESILDVLDTIATGTGILGGTVTARQAVFDAKTNIATIKQKADDAAIKALEAQQKAQIGEILQNGLAAAFDARAGNAGAVDTFSQAIRDLRKIGTPEAYSKQTSLTNFFDAMTKSGLEERNVEDIEYANVMNQLQEADDVQDAFEILTNALNNDKITASQSNTLFTQWDKIKGDNTPEKEDFNNSATGVPDVLNTFLTTITTTPLDEISGADTILVANAKFAFQDMYVDLSRQKQNELKRPLNNTEKRMLAREIITELTPIYVSTDAELGAQDRLDSIVKERTLIEAIENLETQSNTDASSVPNF